MNIIPDGWVIIIEVSSKKGTEYFIFGSWLNTNKERNAKIVSYKNINLEEIKNEDDYE